MQTWKPTFSFQGQSVLDRSLHDHATVSHLKPSLICRLPASTAGNFYPLNIHFIVVQIVSSLDKYDRIHRSMTGYNS